MKACFCALSGRTAFVTNYSESMPWNAMISVTLLVAKELRMLAGGEHSAEAVCLCRSKWICLS